MNTTDYLKNLKKERSLEVVDCHIHPLDVMGVLDVEEHKFDGRKEKFGPSFFDKMKFSRSAYLLSDFGFKFLPASVKKSIKSSYSDAGEARFLREMDKNLIDKAIFLPIEPWTSARSLAKNYKSERLGFLASLDMHNWSLEKIKKELKFQFEELNAIGIKMHPNFQNFMPRSKDNSRNLAEKLELIYSFAVKKQTFILFHGGTSGFLEEKRATKVPKRSKQNALLQNFCDPNGRSELFDFGFPIIIAHLGHFGLNKFDSELFSKICKQNPNVYFDTAAVGPKIIKKALDEVGSKKIILGSDALYNSMGKAMEFAFNACQKTKSKENFDDMIFNIFGGNFKRILRR